MKSKQLFGRALRATRNAQASAGELVGMSRQSVNQMYNNESFKADLLMEMLEKMGISSIYYCDKDLSVINSDELRAKGITVALMRSDGKPVIKRNSFTNPPIKGTINGSVYDLNKCEFIADSFGERGEIVDGSAEELYLDRRGRYIIVEYDDTGAVGAKFIKEDAAKEFIGEHGIHICTD